MLRADHRRTGHCEIWALVDPGGRCPACSGEVAARWAREAAPAPRAQEPPVADAPAFLDVPSPAPADVRAEAGRLLQLLSR